jgi:hypothetical protein
MFKISEEVCTYLLETSKDMQIPGLLEDDKTPYVPRNDNAIGTITPFMAMGTNCKYLIEIDTAKFNDPNIAYDSKGFFLYRKEELLKIEGALELERKMIDHYSESEEKIDISDCAVQLPDASDKIHAMTVDTVEKLFEVLPDIKECLDEERMKLYDTKRKYS